MCFAFIKVKNPAFNMKLLIALAFLLFIVSMATPVSSYVMNFEYMFFFKVLPPN